MTIVHKLNFESGIKIPLCQTLWLSSTFKHSTNLTSHDVTTWNRSFCRHVFLCSWLLRWSRQWSIELSRRVALNYKIFAQRFTQWSSSFGQVSCLITRHIWSFLLTFLTSCRMTISSPSFYELVWFGYLSLILAEGWRYFIMTLQIAPTPIVFFLPSWIFFRFFWITTLNCKFSKQMKKMESR